jgi:reactive intermediate/imine deaminase
MKHKLALLAVVLAGLAAVAVLVPAQSAGRRYINVPGRTDTNPYSNGVLVGNTLYLAGTIGLDPKTGNPPADVETEIRLAMESWKKVLAQAGMTLDDVVSVQVHCPDLALYDKFNAVYRAYFTKNFPARAFLGSGPLLRGGRFEIVGVAIKR